MSAETSKLVSVLMAVGSVNTWLSEAVNSVITQVLPAGWDLELLIGVDGYADSVIAAHKLQQPKIKVYVASKSVGTYVIANSLFAKSSGSIVMRSDADDVMCPDRLKTIISTMADPSIDMVNTYYARVRADNLKLISTKTEAPYGVWAFRRSALLRLGGWVSWICSGDAEILTRAKALRMKLQLIPKVLYLARQHKQQLTKHKDTAPASPTRNHYKKIVDTARHHYASGVKPVPIKPTLTELRLITPDGGRV
jgi:hypothetical protein